jgi:hypothetical protein
MFDSDDESNVTPIQPNPDVDVDLDVNMNNTFDNILGTDNRSTGLSYQTFPSPLITSFQRPRFRKSLIADYGFKPENAPSPSECLSVVTYETMGNDMYPQKVPVESKGIASIQLYVKHGWGLLWQNRSSCKLHYQTTLDQYEKVVLAKATKYEIPHKFFCGGDESTHVQKVVSGDNIFFIQPGDTFDNFH